jgi:probable biosynthetic protein (TIGR04099 family)
MDDLALPAALADLVRAPPLPHVGEATLLGMPHLSGTGLSETWLLKELGHRHWLMLAKAAGMPVPDFRDEAGRPVYAAFCAVRLEGARFDLARENGILAVSSLIARVSRTQIFSRHALELDGCFAGTVEMVSTFVRRTGTSNRSIARVALDIPISVPAGDSQLAGLAAEFRTGRLERHFGFDATDAREIASFRFDPCPAQDFNGAGFLYFTSFLGFVDRAEWQLDREPQRQIAAREVFYYGNVDPGEALRIVLVSKRRDGGTLSRQWQIRGGAADGVLADVYIRRRSERLGAAAAATIG